MTMNRNHTTSSRKRAALRALPLAVLLAAGAVAARSSRGVNFVSPNRQLLPDNADDKRANLAAPKSLKTLQVPEPPNLADFVKNRAAAITLGKALFWDQQVGSDGVQACASCHFHAGADHRTKNNVNPGFDGKFLFAGPNSTRQASDFPLHKFSVTSDRLSTVLRDTNDIIGSQGVFYGTFLSINPGNGKENGTPVTDPTYHVGLVNTRRVTGRQAPSVINAAFNYNNFWDGRANFVFNGVNPFGDADANARVFVNDAAAGLAPARVHITNASLASQAVGPPGSDTEMSLGGRTFPDIGKKMLQLRPLANQLVDPTDSVLGPLSRVTPTLSRPGLDTTYTALIQAAFQDRYWNATTQMVQVDSTGPHVIKKGGLGLAKNYSQMEANFSLFFGLAVQMYESTLISDDTPFDRFQEGDRSAMSSSAQQGLNLFMTPADDVGFAGGSCFNCHFGPEFTKATVSNVGSIPFLGDLPEQIVERMEMGDGGGASYDSGYYNIGVRPTEDDLGRGGSDPFGYPLSFTKRALLNQTAPLPFENPIALCGDGKTLCPVGRMAIDGTFKTPTLRNVELTGPYFHNGGQATLMQVVDFYSRGGDFHEHNIANLDSDIQTLDMTESGKREIVDFLMALTDERVRWEKAPFDHPELVVPSGSPGNDTATLCLPSNPCDETSRLPPVGAAGRAAQGLPPLGTYLDLDPHTH
jgi:cytochrome c peroxidase